MRAVQYVRYGDPEVLEVAEVTEPEAGPGQVRIRVQAAGVNPYDTKVRAGAFAGGRPLARPTIPGLEASGVVDQTGPGVTGIAPGDAVFGFTVGGAAAEYALLSSWARQPGRGLTAVEAGGLAVVADTATRVVDLLEVGADDVVLVHGAAGGVGQAIVQLAVLRGARVVGTASPANHELLAALGAEATGYGPGLVERVRELAPPGPTLVADAAGSQLDDLLALAPRPQAVVTIANFAAAERGVRVTSERGDASALARVAGLAALGRFRVNVSHTFGFAEAAAAHRLSESRSAAGKIVLLP